MNKNIVSVFEFEKVEIPQNISSDVNGEYIKWGINNKYPLFLQELYNECAEHQSIIDTLTLYTIGEGMTSDNSDIQKFFRKVNRYNHTINYLIEQVERDLNIYNGCAIQVIYNRNKQINELVYVDFSKIRLNEKEDLVFYSDKWGSWGSNRHIVYPVFGKGDKNQSEILIFKNRTDKTYPLPHYNAAIRPIMTLIEVTKFHLNNVANGFQPNIIFNFNNGIPDDKIKKEIEEKINEKFVGTSGNKMLITFNESKEKSVSVDQLTDDGFDKKFEQLYKTNQNIIFTSHKITSPALLGIKQEGTGFSKTEFQESFEIFNNTIIKSKQKILIDIIKSLFMNFYSDFNITIEPFKIQ